MGGDGHVTLNLKSFVDQVQVTVSHRKTGVDPNRFVWLRPTTSLTSILTINSALRLKSSNVHEQVELNNNGGGRCPCDPPNFRYSWHDFDTFLTLSCLFAFYITCRVSWSYLRFFPYRQHVLSYTIVSCLWLLDFLQVLIALSAVAYHPDHAQIRFSDCQYVDRITHMASLSATSISLMIMTLLVCIAFIEAKWTSPIHTLILGALIIRGIWGQQFVNINDFLKTWFEPQPDHTFSACWVGTDFPVGQYRQMIKNSGKYIGYVNTSVGILVGFTVDDGPLYSWKDIAIVSVMDAVFSRIGEDFMNIQNGQSIKTLCSLRGVVVDLCLSVVFGNLYTAMFIRIIRRYQFAKITGHPAIRNETRRSRTQT
ncbi:hypothetical protein ABKN59_009334 [Abortiporus biennis]